MDIDKARTDVPVAQIYDLGMRIKQFAGAFAFTDGADLVAA